MGLEQSVRFAFGAVWVVWGGFWFLYGASIRVWVLEVWDQGSDISMGELHYIETRSHCGSIYDSRVSVVRTEFVHPKNGLQYQTLPFAVLFFHLVGFKKEFHYWMCLFVLFSRGRKTKWKNVFFSRGKAEVQRWFHFALFVGINFRYQAHPASGHTLHFFPCWLSLFCLAQKVYTDIGWSLAR